MSEPLSTAVIIKHGGLALFGAIVHALMAHKSGESKTFTNFLILVCISSFSGVMFALLALHFYGNSEYITMSAAGTGGYVGVEGLAFVVDKVKKLIIK